MGPVPTLCALPHLKLLKQRWEVVFTITHFTDGQTEVQGDKETPKSHC